MRILIFVLFYILRSVADADAENFWKDNAIGLFQDYEKATARGAESAFFQSIQTQSARILKKFPPTEWEYVSVGRSGAAIAAYLQVLAESQPEIQIKTLAWSSLRESKKYLDAGVAQFASEYLRLQLPNTSKKTLFIDYVQTGDSVVALNSFLQDLKHQRGYGFYLLLSPEHSVALRLYLKRRLPRASTMVVLSGKDLLFKALQLQSLDFYAEFGRLPIKLAFEEFHGNAQNVKVESQPAQVELVDWLRSVHERNSSPSLVRSCRAIFSLL